MSTISNVVSKVSADIPTVTTVIAQVHGADPVTIALTGNAMISPRSIQVGYWNDGSGLASVAIYGPKLADGRITSSLCKSVYWADTIEAAPEWARQFVNDLLASVTR